MVRIDIVIVIDTMYLKIQDTLKTLNFSEVLGVQGGKCLNEEAKFGCFGNSSLSTMALDGIEVHHLYQ